MSGPMTKTFVPPFAWIACPVLSLAALPGLAHAQSASALTSPSGATTPRSTRGEVTDRRAAARLASRPEAQLELRLAMDELLALDAELHGSHRPESGFGPVATGLLVMGIPIALIGIGVLVAGVITRLASDAAAVSRAVSSFPSTNGGTGSSVDDPTAILIAGGVTLGTGAVLAITGLLLGRANRDEARRWQRRDTLREQIWPALDIELSPAGPSASITLRGAF